MELGTKNNDFSYIAGSKGKEKLLSVLFLPIPHKVPATWNSAATIQATGSEKWKPALLMLPFFVPDQSEVRVHQGKAKDLKVPVTLVNHWQIV